MFMAYIRVRNFAWDTRLSKRLVRSWATRRVKARGVTPRKLSPVEDRVLFMFPKPAAYAHALAHGFHAAVKAHKLPVARQFFDWTSVKWTVSWVDALNKLIEITVSDEDHQRLREWQERAGFPSLSEQIWKNVLRAHLQMDELEKIRDRLKELLGGEDHEPRTLPDEPERPRDADGCVPYRVSAGTLGWGHGGTDSRVG